MLNKIEWHKGCLKKQRIFIKNRIYALNMEIDSIHRAKAECEFYEKQIDKAERMGKKSFNSDIFMKKKGSKNASNA